MIGEGAPGRVTPAARDLALVHGVILVEPSDRSPFPRPTRSCCDSCAAGGPCRGSCESGGAPHPAPARSAAAPGQLVLPTLADGDYLLQVRRGVPTLRTIGP